RRPRNASSPTGLQTRVMGQQARYVLHVVQTALASFSPAKCRTLLIKASLKRKSVALIFSIIPVTEGIIPCCFAVNKTPRVPVIFIPNSLEILRPLDSSIINRQSANSTANPIELASPGSSTYSSPLKKSDDGFLTFIQLGNVSLNS